MGAETAIVKDLMVYGSGLGSVLYRNNTGKLPDFTGRWVEFGLCPGSADIIGIQPVVVTQDMVGKTVGVFVAAECKTLKGKASELQEMFINVIRAQGGKAGITRTREEMTALLRGPFGKA